MLTFIEHSCCGSRRPTDNCFHNSPRFTENRIAYIERITETDGAFILPKGFADLIMGKVMCRVLISEEKMYCVSKGVWHNILVEEGSLIVVIENSDTTKVNSEYMDI